MFYSVDLLSLRNRRGKLSRVWLAATLSDALFKQTVPSNNIQKIAIYAVCEEIMNIVDSRDAEPSGRFSLYLSSQLLYGVTKIYHLQVIIFLKHFDKVKKELLYQKTHDQIRSTDVDASELLELPDIPTPVFPPLGEDRHLLHEALEPDFSVLRQTMGRFDSDLNFGALTEQEVEEFYGPDNLLLLEDLSVRKRLTGAAEIEVPLEVSVPEIDSASHIFRDENLAQADIFSTPTKRLPVKQLGTPSKKRRLTYEDDHVIKTAHAAAAEDIIAVPLDTEEVIEPTMPPHTEHTEIQDITVDPEQHTGVVPAVSMAEQEQMEFEELSQIYQTKLTGRNRKGKFLDEELQLKKDAMRRIMANVKYGTQTHSETRVDIHNERTSAAWLLFQPSRQKFVGIRTVPYKEYWYDDYQSFVKMLVNKKRKQVLVESEAPQFQYEDIDQPRAHEDTTSHEHEVTNKSKDVIAEQSKKELTIDTTDPSKMSEKTLLALKDTHQSVQLNELHDMNQDPGILDINITDGLASEELASTRKPEEIVLPSTSNIDVPMLGESILPEEKKYRHKRKQHISTPSISGTSISTCSESAQWTRSDLSAILEVHWKDTKFVNFIDVVEPETNSKQDAVICFEFILDFVRDGRATLKQEKFGAPLYMQKGKTAIST